MGINMVSIHQSIKALAGTRLLVHKPSLDEKGLRREDLIDDAELKLISNDELAGVLSKAGTAFTM